MIDGAGNLAISLGLNYPEFPDSCRLIKFTLFVNVDQMLIRHFHRYLEQVGNHPLRQPDCLVRESYLDPRVAILGLPQLDSLGCCYSSFQRGFVRLS